MEKMDTQTLFNIAFSTIGVIGGWWLNAVWSAIKDLQKNDREITDKVSAIEVLVAGNYVKNDRFDALAAAIFAKLDKISDKIDRKADK